LCVFLVAVIGVVSLTANSAEAVKVQVKTCRKPSGKLVKVISRKTCRSYGWVRVPGPALQPVKPAVVATPGIRFPNCTALNSVYPHGVGRVGAVDRVRIRPETGVLVTVIG
jgi:hypothetical protein